MEKCNATNLTYYGSTTGELETRLSRHKYCYNCYIKNKYHYVTIFDILKNNDYKIFLIENVNCNNKKELQLREKYFIENNECINNYIPCRTKIEYNETNKEKIKEYQDEYRINNKEKIKEYQDEYRINNKDKIIELNKNLYIKNKDEIQKKQQIYRENNNDNRISYDKNYYQQNKEKILERKKLLYLQNK
jgi:hypothetical protein